MVQSDYASPCGYPNLDPGDGKEYYKDITATVRVEVDVPIANNLPKRNCEETLKYNLKEIFGSNILDIEIQNEGREFITAVFYCILHEVPYPNVVAMGRYEAREWLSKWVETWIKEDVMKPLNQNFEGVELIDWYFEL